MLHLVKIDPDANQWRYYYLDVWPTLFGEWTVRREWGRIGSGGGQTLMRTCETEEEARRLATAKAAEKQRRGYTIAPSSHNWIA